MARHVEVVSQLTQRLSRQYRTTRVTQQQAAWKMRSVSDELRRAVQQARMISAENVFQALRPMIRGLARDEGKEIEFRVTGLNVQADRMVLQALKDPLIHALRNAVVHGIEKPDERAAKGKPRTGQITLVLSTQGNRLEVLVEDDGRGIDMEHVARAAAERGLAPPAPLDSEAGREQLRRILFRPGFSTSPTVTELAGRGMGLSVVQQAVVRLRGSTRIGPRADHGTILRIAVPLVISAERLLLVSAGDQVFAVPTHAVDQLLRVHAKDVQSVEGRRVVLVDDTPLPLAGLGATDLQTPSPNSVLAVVVVRSGVRRAGIVVDGFVAEREALIKSLESPAADVRLFSGAIVLDDSDVALVIDPAALTELDVSAVAQPPTAVVHRTPTVLVVDDSFTTRTLEKSILETNGYTVRVAVDGAEALRMLRSDPVDLVVADVQMPRMDGLTLLKEIRSDEKLESLPLILVTSLERPEDFERGMQLGANAYIVKRKFDHQELLTTIQKFV
ncbi:MAG TPA: response regulator [Polyangiaceae bacterium]|nr:response regulator [Polyangiaceae bacterium]